MACQCDCTQVGLANRRCFIAGLACTAILPMAANVQLAGPPTAEDVTFMRMAIEEARLADFPFGAVVVRDGAVMARGRNRGRTNQDPTAHGEMDARARPSHLARQYALHVGRTVCDVHGRHPVVPRRAAGVCRVGDAARDQDRSDHAVERRGRGQGAICSNLDHRRRAGRRSDGVVQVTRIHDRHPRREGRSWPLLCSPLSFSATQPPGSVGPASYCSLRLQTIWLYPALCRRNRWQPVTLSPPQLAPPRCEFLEARIPAHGALHSPSRSPHRLPPQLRWLLSLCRTCSPYCTPPRAKTMCSSVSGQLV